MKNVLSICVFLIFLSQSLSAQTIDEEKTDEFTGSKTIKTSKEYIGTTGKEYFRLLAITAKEKDGTWDKSITLFIVVYPGEVTSISDKSIIYLKLDNGEVIELKHLLDFKTSLSDDPVIAVVDLNEGVQKKLTTNRVTKLRVSTTQKNVDIELVNSNAESLIKMIEICNQKLAVR